MSNKFFHLFHCFRLLLWFSITKVDKRCNRCRINECQHLWIFLFQKSTYHHFFKNYSKNLTQQSIAKAFGYHPAYISGYFKSRLDIGMSRYINVIRLNCAVQLMRKKKFNMTEIALECGFNSVRTFYRAFRQEFGCSPGDYMANL